MRRLAGLTALIASLAAPPAAGAATFTVDDPGDAPDATPTAADNQCRTAAGRCTLRAAIMQSNATPSADTVVFTHPAGGLTVRPAALLPSISAPLTIDGGGGGVTIAPSAPLAGRLIDFGPAAPGSAIRSLTLDGDPAGSGSSGPLVQVAASDVTIDRVIARNSTADGIGVASSAQRVRITRSPVFGYAPGAAAIALAPGANGDVPPPTLRVGPRRADGTLPVTGGTAGEGVVELFRGDPGTGPQEFTADTETAGSFGFVPGIEPAPGEKFSATFRDPAGDTSAFTTATTPSDVASPSLLGGVAVNLSAVRVQPSEPVDPSTVQPDDFALTMAGSDRPIGGVSVAPDGSTVTLFSSTPWLNGEAGTVTLRGPGAVSDIAGNQSLQPQTVRVGGAPGDFIAPAVTSLRVTPRSRICISKGPRCRKPGAYVSFVSSEEGDAVYTFVRGKRLLGQRRYSAKAGRNRIRFDGRVRGRKLTAGRYKLYVGVEDRVGNVSTTQPRSLFSIRSTTRKR